MPIAIRNRNEIDGYLVPPAVFDRLSAAVDELRLVHAVLPLLLAAVRANVAIPSRTLEDLGISGELDWSAINALLSSLTVPLTHDEAGHPMPAPVRGLEQEILDEPDDEELILVDGAA